MVKCKKCEKEALPGSEYCASCREDHNHGWKTFWKVAGGVCVVVAAAVGSWIGLKESDSGGSSNA